MKPEDAVIIKTLVDYGRGEALFHHHELQPIALAAADRLRALLDGYRAVKRVGVWRPVGFDKRGRGGVWVCSSCKRCHPLKSDFCPMCGADMRGPEPGRES